MLKLIFFLFISTTICANTFADDNAMLNRMVKVLQKHTKILEDWSHKNKEQTDNLLEISKNS